MDDKKYFVGIGAQRAGTSWLYKCLAAHPDIYMPRKEIHFFDNEYSRGEDWYDNLFKEKKNEHVYGELSPDYIYSVEYLDRIKSYNKEARIIICLRNPVERCYSAYCLYQSQGMHTGKSFAQVLADDKSIIGRSLYFEQIMWVKNRFPDSAVIISLYDDLQSNPQDYIKNIYRFLQVDETFKPNALDQKYNIALNVKNKYFMDIFAYKNRIEQSKYKQAFQLVKDSALGNAARKAAVRYHENKKDVPSLPVEYHELLLEDISRLSSLLERSLDSWTLAVTD